MLNLYQGPHYRTMHIMQGQVKFRLTFPVDKDAHNRLTERYLDCFVEIIIIIDWK